MGPEQVRGGQREEMSVMTSWFFSQLLPHMADIFVHLAQQADARRLRVSDRKWLLDRAALSQTAHSSLWSCSS